MLKQDGTAVVVTAQSADGTSIAYHRLGNGPGLVVMPGSMSSASDYARLSRALASSFTLYLVDRRGHGLSGRISTKHSMATEVEDLALILQQTKAPYLFGHSIGGLIALQTVTTSSVSVEKLALYEPPLSVGGSIPDAWVPQMQEAMARKRYANAMAIVMKGLQLSHDASRLPVSALTALIAVMMRVRKGVDGETWRQHIIGLLPTMPADMRLVGELDSTQQRFLDLPVATLLLDGGKSAPHFRLAVQTLAETLPRARRSTLPGLEHNAPNNGAPETVAKELLAFFSRESTSATE
jgi:pimeloyl-ACP methyl ester carboxylesterase